MQRRTPLSVRVEGGCAILAALALGGCGSVTPGPTEPSRFVRTARSRGQLEMGCTDPNLFVQPLGAGAYRVEGCGEYITYLCIEDRRTYSRPIICTLQERGRRE